MPCADLAARDHPVQERATVTITTDTVYATGADMAGAGSDACRLRAAASDRMRASMAVGMTWRPARSSRSMSGSYSSWFFANLYTRAVSPSSPTTIPADIARQLPLQSARQMQSLAAIYLYHPLARRHRRHDWPARASWVRCHCRSRPPRRNSSTTMPVALRVRHRAGQPDPYLAEPHA